MANEDTLNPGTETAPKLVRKGWFEQPVSFNNTANLLALINVLGGVGTPAAPTGPLANLNPKKVNTQDAAVGVGVYALTHNPLFSLLGAGASLAFGHPHHDSQNQFTVQLTDKATREPIYLAAKRGKEGALSFKEIKLDAKGNPKDVQGAPDLSEAALFDLVKNGQSNGSFFTVDPMSVSLITPEGWETDAVTRYNSGGFGLKPITAAAPTATPAGFNLSNPGGVAPITAPVTPPPEHTRGVPTPPKAAETVPTETKPAETATTIGTTRAATLNFNDPMFPIFRQQLDLLMAQHQNDKTALIVYGANDAQTRYDVKGNGFSHLVNGKSIDISMSEVMSNLQAAGGKFSIASTDPKFIAQVEKVEAENPKLFPADAKAINTPTTSPATNTANLDAIANRIYTTAADYWDNVSGAQAKNATGARAKAAWEALPEDSLKKDIAKLLGDYVATHPQGKRTDLDNPFTNGDLKKLLQAKLTGQDFAKLTRELDAADAKGKTAGGTFAASTAPTKSVPQIAGEHYTGQGKNTQVQHAKGDNTPTAHTGARAAKTQLTGTTNIGDAKRVSEEFRQFVRYDAAMARRMADLVASGATILSGKEMHDRGQFFIDYDLSKLEKDQKVWNAVGTEIKNLSPDAYHTLQAQIRSELKDPTSALNAGAASSPRIDPASAQGGMKGLNIPAQAIPVLTSLLQDPKNVSTAQAYLKQLGVTATPQQIQTLAAQMVHNVAGATAGTMPQTTPVDPIKMQIAIKLEQEIYGHMQTSHSWADGHTAGSFLTNHIWNGIGTNKLINITRENDPAVGDAVAGIIDHYNNISHLPGGFDGNVSAVERQGATTAIYNNITRPDSLINSMNELSSLRHPYVPGIAPTAAPAATPPLPRGGVQGISI